MRPLLVVFAQPVVGYLAHLLDGFEDVGIEYFLPIGLVEALDEGVLIGFARLDKPNLSLANRRAPGCPNRSVASVLPLPAHSRFLL